MTTATATVHCFEKAGLGLAPFKLIGIQTTADIAELNAHRAAHGQMFTTNHCGGTCDYCGMAISDVYKIRSADGKEFKVGCDCVLKTGEKGIVDLVKKASAEIATAKRHTREKAKIDAAAKLIADNADALAAMPHPAKWAADNGQTALDYAEWMFANSGNAGKIKCGQVVKKLLGK